MIMWTTICLAAYVFGVAVIPIVFGIVHSDELASFGADDYLLLFAVDILWPVMAVAAAVMALAYAVFVGPYNAMKWLVKKGAEFSKKWEAAKAAEALRMELEHTKRVLNAKPDDKEHFDYVHD